MVDGSLRWPVSVASGKLWGLGSIGIPACRFEWKSQRDRLSARRATTRPHTGLERCGFAAGAGKGGLALTIGGISAKRVWRRIGAAHCWRRRRRWWLGGASGQQKQQRRNQAKFHEWLYWCKNQCHIALTLVSRPLILPIATGETRPDTGQANFFLNPQRAGNRVIEMLSFMSPSLCAAERRRRAGPG